MLNAIQNFISSVLPAVLTIIGAVSGIWGIISPFVKIESKHEFKISRRSAVLLLVCLLCVSARLVLLSEGAGAAQTGDVDRLPPVVVSQVTLNYTVVDLTVGDAKPLLATVLYSDGQTDHAATWTSSNPSVASVDSMGIVTALSAGTTEIIACANKNNVWESTSCYIVVSGPPTAPTGYSIRLSTDQALMYEIFRVYITPFENDVTDIQIYTISPSGLHKNFPLNDDGRYFIDTEAGTWTIYASVSNAMGTYVASRDEDYVTIEITRVEDAIDDILSR